MRTNLIKGLMLSSVFLAGITLFAGNTEKQNTLESKTTSQTAKKDGKKSNLLTSMPKIFGYLQTGYVYGNKYSGDKSTFQMKRMRLFIDKKVSERFDFRTQMECFSGSTDSGKNHKKLITIMDAFASYHINKGINFRAGQYYLPFGFENYDIAPSTLETIDFSNICYRMICRNAITTPYLIDYGRDVGIMAYGDLIQNKGKGFYYISYQLSLTNGYLPTLLDNNKSKDFNARITIRPIKNLRLISCYQYGESPFKNNKYAKMNKFDIGAWYLDPNGLTLRGEYAMMYSDKNQANIDERAAYVLAGYKLGQFIPVIRWEMYRDKNLKSSAINKDIVTAGVTYQLKEKVKFQLNYTFTKYQKEVNMGGDGHGLALMCLVHF